MNQLIWALISLFIFQILLSSAESIVINVYGSFLTHAKRLHYCSLGIIYVVLGLYMYTLNRIVNKIVSIAQTHLCLHDFHFGNQTKADFSCTTQSLWCT